MSLIFKIFFSVLILVFISTFTLTRTTFAIDETSNIEKAQLIIQLLKKIEELKRLIATSPISPSVVVPGKNPGQENINLLDVNKSAVCHYVWTRNLTVGDKGVDVLELQKLLNSDSETQIAPTGDGSKGFETGYYGSKTMTAVKQFQEKYPDDILVPSKITNGSGFFGNVTRKKANTLCTMSSSQSKSKSKSKSRQVVKDITPPVLTQAEKNINAAKQNLSLVANKESEIKEVNMCDSEWKGKSLRDRLLVGLHNKLYPNFEYNKSFFVPGYALLMPTVKGTKDVTKDSIAFDKMVGATEEQIYVSLENYFYNVTDLYKYSDGEYIIVLDVEGIMAPNDLRYYTPGQIQRYTEAMKLRFKVVRSFFPNSSLSLYGVATMYGSVSLQSNPASDPEKVALMAGLRRAGTYGLFDNIEYISPSFYFKLAPEDRSVQQVGFDKYITYWFSFATNVSASLKKSNGRGVCVLPVTTLVYLNGASVKHNQEIPQDIFDKSIKDYMLSVKDRPDVGAVLVWAGNELNYLQREYKLNLDLVTRIEALVK